MASPTKTFAKCHRLRVAQIRNLHYKTKSRVPRLAGGSTSKGNRPDCTKGTRLKSIQRPRMEPQAPRLTHGGPPTEPHGPDRFLKRTPRNRPRSPARELPANRPR